MNSTDKIVPVSFQLQRNGRVKLYTEEYIKLMTNSRTYVLGKGKKAVSFNIVHTSAGYVDVNDSTADWIADHFEIKSVVADDKNNHYAVIETTTGTFRIPFEGLLSNKIDVTLFNKGIAISKANNVHEALSMHLQWLLGNFEVQDAKTTLGWKYKNDQLMWCGANTDPPLLKYKLSLPSEEEYFKKFNSLIQGCEALQFALCTAAASTLLAYLHMTAKIPVASFGLSLVGTSSTGKTTALQLAASLYSSPDDETVYTGFYGTNNALVRILGFHKGVVLCYNESTIDNNINKANFVYTFTEGKSKLRLDQQSQLKERDTWLCTCLFSSETHLVDISNNDNLGLGVRILNLENCCYTRDARHADEIKTFAGMNYGIVGNKISEYLLNQNPEEVSKDYNELKEAVSSLNSLNRSSLTDRLILNFTLILHTAVILTETGINIDIQAIKSICVDINNKITESAQPGRNLICKVFNLISCKYKHLKGIKWTCGKDSKPVKVAIIETTFAEMLEECGITDIRSSVNNLDKEGFLIRQSNNRLKSKLSIDGVPCYAYQIDIAMVNAAFGPIDDDIFSNVIKKEDYPPFSNNRLSIDNDEEAIIHAGNHKIRSNKKAVSGTAFLL